MSPLTTPFHIILEALTSAIRQKEKEIKYVLIRTEKIKLSLFTDGMTVYVESLKKTTKILLEPISNNSNVLWYKDNTQKSIATLCTSNKELKLEISQMEKVKNRMILLIRRL